MLWQHPVKIERDGGSRYKLPETGGPEGDPAPKYVAYFYFRWSALAGGAQKALLTGTEPVLSGPGQLVVSHDRHRQREKTDKISLFTGPASPELKP